MTTHGDAVGPASAATPAPELENDDVKAVPAANVAAGPASSQSDKSDVTPADGAPESTSPPAADAADEVTAEVAAEDEPAGAPEAGPPAGDAASTPAPAETDPDGPTAPLR